MSDLDFSPSLRPLAACFTSILMIAGCGGSDGTDPSTTTPPASETKAEAESPATPETAQSPSDILDQVIAGPQRSADHKARDEFRHPKQTIEFFGVAPDMTVVEVSPGGGWYTRIIAPYLAAGNGTYIAMNSDPGDNQRRIDRLEAFKTTFGDEAVFGNVNVALIGGETPAVEPGTADVVLTFRNVHNWMRGDVTNKMFGEFYSALKPGGVLGVVEHRGDPDVAQDPDGSTGYVREDVVMAMATKAGFEFEAKSEINANAKDDRDHPFGVWTLKPVRRSSRTGEPDPDFDRAGYDAIGESDRMTMKFRKPLADEGALLE